MLSTIANIHRHKLPKPGAIVRIVGLQRNGYYPLHRWQVESFPLCDNVRPYSFGIHTVNLRRLADNARARVSGFYCEEV